MSDLDRAELAPERADGGRPVTTMMGHPHRRAHGAARPLSSVTSPPIRIPARPTDAAVWSGRLHRMLVVEIRSAVASGVLTGAEGDQLFARLVLVIDQAVVPPGP